MALLCLTVDLETLSCIWNYRKFYETGVFSHSELNTDADVKTSWILNWSGTVGKNGHLVGTDSITTLQTWPRGLCSLSPCEGTACKLVNYTFWLSDNATGTKLTLRFNSPCCVHPLHFSTHLLSCSLCVPVSWNWCQVLYLECPVVYGKSAPHQGGRTVAAKPN